MPQTRDYQSLHSTSLGQLAHAMSAKTAKNKPPGDSQIFKAKMHNYYILVVFIKQAMEFSREKSQCEIPLHSAKELAPSKEAVLLCPEETTQGRWKEDGITVKARKQNWGEPEHGWLCPNHSVRRSLSLSTCTTHLIQTTLVTLARGGIQVDELQPICQLEILGWNTRQKPVWCRKLH